jgi:hypothetical protein
MNTTPTTNQRLVTILLILLIIFVALLVIGVVAGFFMMGGWMRGGMMTNPMMGGYNNNYANAKPLTVEQAKAAAEKYLTNLNNSDLKITEVMIFNKNAYVVVKETSTGNGAFELLADAGSQVAYPEYGPNMMWNLKYGCLNMEQMMGGNNSMMGGGMMGNCDGNNATAPNVSAEMTVNPEQAIEFAQKYLNANIPGATAATDPTKFYGYYTLDFEKDGKVAGMLSVNGYSGQVFLHTWHGTFIEELEFQ